MSNKRIARQLVRIAKSLISTDMDKHIWEGWTVGDFVDELEPTVDLIMSGGSWKKPFNNKRELASWLKDNQPYYKKAIPEVVGYFAKKYNLR